MEFDDYIEQIAQILDLATAPSADQACRLNDLLEEVYADGISAGRAEAA